MNPSEFKKLNTMVLNKTAPSKSIGNMRDFSFYGAAVWGSEGLLSLVDKHFK
jgi:hypothetical protein